MFPTRAHLTAWQPRNELSFNINFHHRRVSLHIQIFYFYGNEGENCEEQSKNLNFSFLLLFFVNENYIRGAKKKVFNESRSFSFGRRHAGCLVWSVGSCAIKRKMREKYFNFPQHHTIRAQAIVICCSLAKRWLSTSNCTSRLWFSPRRFLCNEWKAHELIQHLGELDEEGNS